MKLIPARPPSPGHPSGSVHRDRAPGLLLAVFLAAIPFPGCRESPSSPSPPRAEEPPRPAAAPPADPGAGAPAPAAPPARAEPSGKAAPAGSRAGEDPRVARAGEMVDAWLKAIESGDAKAAEGFLISEKELEANATEGFLEGFSSGLLPMNLQLLGALRKTAKEEKELNLVEWSPRKPSKSTPGSAFRSQVLVMENCKLELIIGDESAVLFLTLIEVDGRWKILKLGLPESEKEE